MVGSLPKKYISLHREEEPKKAKNELEAKKGEKEPTASGTKRLACFSPPRLLLASDCGSRYTLQRRCLQSRSFVNIWFGLERQSCRPSF